jgi:hypothetical protein
MKQSELPMSMTEIPKEIFVLPAVVQHQQEPETAVPEQEIDTSP